MRKRRRSEGFNLAFLDIMSCGLGAIVLVFMLIKYNVSDSNAEVNNLTREAEYLEAQKTGLEQELNRLHGITQSEAKKISNLKVRLTQIKEEIFKKNTSLVNKKRRLVALQADIANKSMVHEEDLIAEDRGGEENYLIGLKVEGSRIAILIDSSASMTDEKLLNIIKRKNSSVQNKKEGDKWIRTKKIVRWLLTRTPKESQLRIIAFNDSVQSLVSSKWFTINNSAVLKNLYKELDALVPSGATNLQRGLQAISKVNTTDLYIITDGLPTTGESNYTSLNPFSGCSSLLGNSKLISGECRIKLFRQTIKETNLDGIKINVILLPIEGDPDAVNEYWSWTARTGGLVISPAGNWP